MSLPIIIMIFCAQESTALDQCTYLLADKQFLLSKLTGIVMSEELEQSYLWGFGNGHASEAIPGSLPTTQNSPQHCPFDLYAEQISGSSFTRARAHTLLTWVYRLAPSALNNRYEPYDGNVELDFTTITDPNPMRWRPLPNESKQSTFFEGLKPLLCAGSLTSLAGGAIYLYGASKTNHDEFFCNHDGDMLLVPHSGTLHIHTELGSLSIAQGQIAVIPRGIVWQVELNETVTGYALENYGEPFQLPELGPIGANGLANPRDFFYPRANFKQNTGNYKIVCKVENTLWQKNQSHHPLNVVAWQGNFAPYGYDLSRFNTMNTVSFDHPDPSIFTVLSSPSAIEGQANFDFVIFPERWMVAEHTFRPPYYHRNIMSEYMGLIKGKYDAKSDAFLPGGGSLHNRFTPHGPDSRTYQTAIDSTLSPVKQENTLAFMFESIHYFFPTKFAMDEGIRESGYARCWDDLKVASIK